MIELWHEWNSVHSFRVRVVLAEKALAWTDRTIELLKFEHLQPAYLRLNPAGVVPTLVHGGRIITESSVICQYLDEFFPEPPLLAADPFERAQARIWLKHFDDIVHPALRKASFELLYRNILRRMPRPELAARLAAHPDAARARSFIDAADGGTDEAVVKNAMDCLAKTIGRIDRALFDRDWLGGPFFGLADAAMASMIERLEHLRQDALFRASPRVREWSARILARPSIINARATGRYRLPLIDQ